MGESAANPQSEAALSALRCPEMRGQKQRMQRANHCRKALILLLLCAHETAWHKGRHLRALRRMRRCEDEAENERKRKENCASRFYEQKRRSVEQSVQTTIFRIIR